MDGPDELHILEGLLDRCEQDTTALQAHRGLISTVRESVALLRYEQPARVAAKKKALRKHLSTLRANVATLSAPTTGPRERFKVVRQVTEALSAIQQLLEAR